jgi:hypothetical protein
MLLGVVTLLEMAYRRSTQPEVGARMKLFGITLDTSTPWPWIGAALLAAVGYFAARRAWPRVAAAWALAREGASARG